MKRGVETKASEFVIRLATFGLALYRADLRHSSLQSQKEGRGYHQLLLELDAPKSALAELGELHVRWRLVQLDRGRIEAEHRDIAYFPNKNPPARLHSPPRFFHDFR